MNQRDRDHIRTHYLELLEDLKTAITDVCIYLWKSKIISLEMRETVLEGRNTPRERARALLDLLPTRGPLAYDFFYTAAFKSELFTVADILKPDRAPHQDFADPQFWEDPIQFDIAPLPEYWPSKEALAGIDEKIRLITAKDTNLCQLYSNHLVAGQDSIYPITQEHRGRAVIINNEEFDHLPNRTGSQKDQTSAEHLFQSFGFKVVCHNDKKNTKMWEVLQSEATNSANQGTNCFILMILSHGDEGVVFGTDGGWGVSGQPQACTSIKDLRNLFCRVPELQGKPKLFFINTCRARFVEVEGTIPELHDSDTITHQTARSDAADAPREELGSQADVFLAMATVADSLTWRNTQIGTFFIQAIVYIFAHYGYKYEISILMRMVNRLLRRSVIKDGKKNPQTCEYISTLQKAFYFFPGLPRNLPSKN